MIATKKNWLKRTLSLLLAFVMLLSISILNVFAVDTDELPTGYKRAVQLKAPAEDGVYYADIDLMNYSQMGQTSMGNSALRGSKNFLQKHPEDTEYRSIVIVRDGKATALVEFMPMGYLGMYGMLYELEAVTPEAYSKYGAPAEEYSTYTAAQILTEHRTSDDSVVYDGYNDPESSYKFDGSNPSEHTRPAGYGHSESRLVNIVGEPYSRLMALDITPITIQNDNGLPASPEEFTQEHAAAVHVFVPVMFDISPSSGDQYARMMVDWTTLEKIENPENVLNYRLYSAMQITEANYTSESYGALQDTIAEIQTAMSNVWPQQHLSMNGTGYQAQPVLDMKQFNASEEAELTGKLNDTVSALEERGDKSELNAVIEKANSIDRTLYTQESLSNFDDALKAAVSVQNNNDAGVSAVSKAVNTLDSAIADLKYLPADYGKVQAAIHAIPDDLFSICAPETAQAVITARDAVDWTLNITEQSKADAYADAILNAIDKLEYLGADYAEVAAAISKIPVDLSIYTDETVQALAEARDAVDWTKDITKQSVVNSYADAIESAISRLIYKPADYKAVNDALDHVPADLTVYTDETAATLTGAINAVVRGKNMSEQTLVNSYAEEIEKAIAELIYKPAVYTAVDEALKNIPEDLTIYTVKTVEALKDAQTAVDRNKNITEQDTVNSYAEAIENAVKNLKYKPADYSAVDKALSGIPADLADYTDESAQAVEAAKNAVIYGKNITEQSAVDTMAEAINTAVANLKKKDGALDKDNLEDGVYSVYGEMIKVNRRDKSMSNDAINHTIQLTVRNGQYYLTIDFHGLSYLNRFGYLANLSYYDNGYTYGQYGKIEGTLLPAKVLSTQKNADGSDVIDEFNQTGGSSEGTQYPDRLEFPLVPDALNDLDGYIPLHVFVPVMEDISTGTGDQDVLLRLDWSTLKKTTEDDPGFQPDEPVEQSPAVDYTDKATGVTVHADKGVFEEGVQVIVTEITKDGDYDNTALSLSDIGKKFKLYDVKFLDKEGNELAPNGTVTISFPIASGYNSANLAVYRINEDGSKTLVKGTIEDGFYKIVTKTAAQYALVEKDSTITDEQNTANVNDGTNSGTTTGTQTGVDAPQTGDNSHFALWFMLMLASAGMLAVLTLTRKRETTKGE